MIIRKVNKKNKLQRTITLLVSLLFLILNLSAQETIDSTKLKPKYGGYLNIGFDFHTSDFSKLPGVPSCCPKFDGGSGSGISIGALYDLPIDTNYYLSIRAGFSSYNGLLKKNQVTTGIIDGKSSDLIFEHSLDASFSTIGIEPLFSYRFYKNFSAHAGARLGFLLSSTYSQKEEIIVPADRGTFIDGTRVRNSTSGNIPESASFQAAFVAGVSIELPLNKKKWLFLSPELYYSFWFTPIVSGTSWSVHSLRGGASVKYMEPPPPPPPPPPPLLPPDPAFPKPPKPPVISVSISAVQIDSNNVEKKDFGIKIEDFISLNMRPLLNYVFFEENSSELPKRYNKLKPNETQRFTLKQLANYDVMPTYYHILNIVGKRLRENSEATIRLVGTNSNIGIEKGNTDLSKARAEAVRNYLRDVWGIEESRIAIQARNLPKESSNNDEPGGAEENRRVEILSDDMSILEPVITSDTLRKISTSTIRFLPVIKSESTIENWNLNVKQGNKVLVAYQGTGKPPDKIDWIINEKDTSAPKSGGTINYVFSATDKIGLSGKTQLQSLPVEQLTIDKKRIERIQDREFEYYSLILFDYGKSDLAKEHKSVLDFVKNRISDESMITITGYTDSMGDEEVNFKLSENRARNAAKRLNIKNATVMGSGESELLYDNTLPEGRFYCRTVKITIETPVKNGQ